MRLRRLSKHIVVGQVQCHGFGRELLNGDDATVYILSIGRLIFVWDAKSQRR